MASPNTGLIKGKPLLIWAELDTTSAAIVPGTIMTEVSAGLYKEAAAGDVPVGVSHSRGAVPAAAGDVKILMDVSNDTIYSFPADAGTVSRALKLRTMDVGGSASIDIDASADDNVLCVDVDVDLNHVHVIFLRTLTGIV